MTGQRSGLVREGYGCIGARGHTIEPGRGRLALELLGEGFAEVVAVLGQKFVRIATPF